MPNADARREQDYYMQVRLRAQEVLAGIIWLVNDAQIDWNALQYGTNLDDGANEHQGLTKTDLSAVVFDTANALKAVLDANGGGHIGNLARLKLPTR